MVTWEKVRLNPTLYTHALLPGEGPGFAWHKDADREHSSQVFCVSAFGTLRTHQTRDTVVNQLLGTSADHVWTLQLEAKKPDLLNERGLGMPSNIDALLISSDAVFCVESKFGRDAVQGFSSCSQPEKRQCAGHFGPSSDLKTKTEAWCRLEVWDGKRSPRLYWSLGRAYFSHSVFEPQQRGARCVFNGPNFQLMRNFLLAAAFAQRNRKQQIGVLAVCPRAGAATLRDQIDAFKADVLRPPFHDLIRLRTYEDYIALLRGAGNADAAALAAFMEDRIRVLIPRP